MAKARKANVEKIAKIKAIINTQPNFIVVFDLETTGFEYASGHKIIEIGAVKFKKVDDSYVQIDTFSQLLNPEIYKVDEEGKITNILDISSKIISLTGITPEMLYDQPNYEEVLPKFNEFVKDCVLVAQNASFDMNFTRFYMEKLGLDFSNDAIDTLEMARDQLRELTSHNLVSLCKHFEITQENHHRAVDDCKVTSEVFFKLYKHYIEDQLDIFSVDSFKDKNPEEVDSFKDESIEELNLIPFHKMLQNPNDEVLKEIKDNLISVAYWSKPNIERIYVNTTGGNCYFNLLANEIGMDPWEMNKLIYSPVAFEKVVLDFMEMESIDEFSKFRGKKFKKTKV